MSWQSLTHVHMQTVLTGPSPNTVRLIWISWFYICSYFLVGLSLASSSKSANLLISTRNWISGFNIHTELYTYPVEYTYPIENIPYQFKIFTWVSNNFTEILTFVKWFTTFNHFKQFLSNLTIKNLKLVAQFTLFSLESLCTQQWL